jgi:hypothetical protein
MLWQVREEGAEIVILSDFRDGGMTADDMFLPPLLVTGAVSATGFKGHMIFAPFVQQ